jgi:hypothetical protein
MAGRPRTEWTHFLSFHRSQKKTLVHYPATSSEPRDTRTGAQPDHAGLQPTDSCPTLIAFDNCGEQYLYLQYLAKHSPRRSHSVISREMPP